MYGTIYSRLFQKTLSQIAGFKLNHYSACLLQIYFKLFGYPDIAGQFRFPLVTRYLNPQTGEKILDAGSGNGIYANTYGYQYGCLVTGVDLRPRLISSSSKVAKNLNSTTNFLVGDLTTFKSKLRFDKIYCLEVMEHIIPDQATFFSLSKLLKPKGTFVVSVPAKSSQLTSEHVRTGYTIREIKSLAQKASLSLDQVSVYYHSLAYQIILLQQYLNHLSPLLNLFFYPFLMAISSLLEKSSLSDNEEGYVFKLVKK